MEHQNKEWANKPGIPQASYVSQEAKCAPAWNPAMDRSRSMMNSGMIDGIAAGRGEGRDKGDVLQKLAELADEINQSVSVYSETSSRLSAVLLPQLMNCKEDVNTRGPESQRSELAEGINTLVHQVRELRVKMQRDQQSLQI